MVAGDEEWVERLLNSEITLESVRVGIVSTPQQKLVEETYKPFRAQTTIEIEKVKTTKRATQPIERISITMY